MEGLVIAGIGTDVGKTVAAAIIVESMKADYWKPIQAGELDYTDSDKVQELISNNKSVIHQEAFRFSKPMSPHAAAEFDRITLKAELIEFPKTENTLIIELAGGILVPLNQTETNIDLIKKWQLPVILVVNFYLGSINHTLLSVDVLKKTNCSLTGLLFNGEENFQSKQVILSTTGFKDLGTIPRAQKLDKNFISAMAQKITFN